MLRKTDLVLSVFRQIAYRFAVVLFLAGCFDYPAYSHILICISFSLASISDSLVTSSCSSTHRKVIFIIYGLMASYNLIAALSWLRLSHGMVLLNLMCLANSLLCIGISIISRRIPEHEYLTHAPTITCYVAFIVFSIVFVLYGWVVAPFKNILSIASLSLSVLLLAFTVRFLVCYNK